MERLLEDVRFAVLEQRHIIEERTERGAAKGSRLTMLGKILGGRNRVLSPFILELSLDQDL